VCRATRGSLAVLEPVWPLEGEDLLALEVGHDVCVGHLLHLVIGRGSLGGGKNCPVFLMTRVPDGVVRRRR